MHSSRDIFVYLLKYLRHLYQLHNSWHMLSAIFVLKTYVHFIFFITCGTTCTEFYTLKIQTKWFATL